MRSANEVRISVIGINGSPSKTDRCTKLLKEALKQCKAEGADIEMIRLDKIEKSLFRLGDVDKPPRKIKALLEQVSDADALILASPVHWFGVSSLMKNFIDHLSNLEARNFKLEGSVLGFIVTFREDGGMKAVSDMAGPLNHMGAIVPPYCTFFHNKRMANKSEDKWMVKGHKLLAENVVRMARLTRETTWS